MTKQKRKVLNMAKSQKGNEWDKIHMKTVSTHIKKNEAEMFEEYAEKHHTTRSRILHDYIMYCVLHPNEPPVSPTKR